MKNNQKNTPRSLGQWAKKQQLDKTQKQSLKGGYDPWLEKK